MITMELPPKLANLHSQLSSAIGPGAQRLRTELETLGEIVAHVRATDPNAAVLRRMFATPDDGFTGPPIKTCMCCGQTL
jgi:hypothetical protein